MSEKPVTLEPVKPERPRAEPGSTVSFWCRESEHDELVRMARDRRTTLSRLMQTIVAPHLRKPR